MDVEILKHWLNSSRDYDTGVRLYLEYGDNDAFKDLFASEGQSAFKEQKLQSLLTDLYRNYQTPDASATKKPLPPVEPATSHKRWPAQPITDPVILALWKKWRPMFSEMQSLQHRIYEVALAGQTDPNKSYEAGQMAFRIKDLEDDVQEIYSQRDFYIEHNQLPDAPKQPDEEIVDPIRWAIELKNNERYVRDYRLKLGKDPDNKNAVKWAAALKEKEAAVAKYKRLLKLD